MPTQDYKQASQHTFDKIADQYESHYTGKHARKIYSRVSAIVQELAPGSVLDVGCGKGNLLAMLHTQNTQLSGVDLSLEMLRHARQRLGDAVELKNADSEYLPWQAKQFDLVICTDSFHHYPNPKKVLQEIRRVLKDNGHLVIGEPWLPEPLRRLVNISFKFGKHGDVKMYSRAEWEMMLAATGFSIVRWEKSSLSSLVLTARVGE